jgi:hypothetical protein
MVFAYSADLPAGVPLAANTTFYLSVVNDTGAQNSFWAWAGSGPGSDFFRFADGEGWEGPDPPVDHAFELTIAQEEVIPEPTSLILFGLASVSAVGYSRWRRWKQPLPR